MAVVDPKNWPLDNQQIRAKKGKLIRIERLPGQFVKMYEADAIAQGFIKAKPQAENKMRKPVMNKTEPEAQPEGKPQADDFTTISGIGKASARTLVSHGITTFEQLRTAGNLDYLSAKAQEAVEEWRINV